MPRPACAFLQSAQLCRKACTWSSENSLVPAEQKPDPVRKKLTRIGNLKRLRGLIKRQGKDISFSVTRRREIEPAPARRSSCRLYASRRGILSGFFHRAAQFFF